MLSLDASLLSQDTQPLALTLTEWGGHREQAGPLAPKAQFPSPAHSWGTGHGKKGPVAPPPPPTAPGEDNGLYQNPGRAVAGENPPTQRAPLGQGAQKVRGGGSAVPVLVKSPIVVGSPVHPAAQAPTAGMKIVENPSPVMVTVRLPIGMGL